MTMQLTHNFHPTHEELSPKYMKNYLQNIFPGNVFYKWPEYFGTGKAWWYTWTATDTIALACFLAEAAMSAVAMSASTGPGRLLPSPGLGPPFTVRTWDIPRCQDGVAMSWYLCRFLKCFRASITWTHSQRVSNPTSRAMQFVQR